jgi:hypothetical protein
MELIKQYIESKISNESFFEELYKNQELQKILDEEVTIPPYTKEGSLLLYLLSGDIKDVRFIINSKDALRQFFKKNNIAFQESKKEEELYSILLESQPKWLDAPIEYFSDIMKDYDGNNKIEIKNRIKEKIKDNFICINNKPQWLQSPSWPIEDRIPLVFIGELDMSEIMHDTSKVYVFFNTKKKTYTNVEQSL